jgi:hypothetical protein
LKLRKMGSILSHILESTKNVGFRNTANSVPLMYGLMSFGTVVVG